MDVRRLNRAQLEAALPFVWAVFCAFEAAYYPPGGREAFYRAIHTSSYLDELSAYGAFDGDRLVGLLATRNGGAHIALFFVDGGYQRRGIGRKLLETYLAGQPGCRITVHSSQYAVEIYKRLGFTPMGGVREEEGIRYIPMALDRFNQMTETEV